MRLCVAFSTSAPSATVEKERGEHEEERGAQRLRPVREALLPVRTPELPPPLHLLLDAAEVPPGSDGSPPAGPPPRPAAARTRPARAHLRSECSAHSQSLRSRPPSAVQPPPPLHLEGTDELDEQHEQREGERDHEDRRERRVLGGGRRRWRRACWLICRWCWRCRLLCWPALAPAPGLGLGRGHRRLRLLSLLGRRLRQPWLSWRCLAGAMSAGLALAPATLAVRLGRFAPLCALRRRRVLLSERSRCPRDALRCERESV